jgi:hypothetical protein
MAIGTVLLFGICQQAGWEKTESVFCPFKYHFLFTHHTSPKTHHLKKLASYDQ